jgi:mercuric ion binding protein
MKYLKIINRIFSFTSIVLFAILFSVQIANAQQAKKNEKVVIKTSIYCDHCKECETCGKNFQTNMLKIKGVKMYELDEKKRIITVYYNGQKTDLLTIKKGISKLGFDADEIKAEVASYEKLDDCCKKNKA